MALHRFDSDGGCSLKHTHMEKVIMTIEIEIPSEVDIHHLKTMILTLADYSENVTNEEFGFLSDLFSKLKP